ncbi:MAG TPA: hypothetical protein HA326_09030 [Thermoplasmata archaeon]|nr:hypothetical protein [Thermoplasmata archaeon]
MVKTARKRPRRGTERAGLLERLDHGVVLGDGGYLLELEKRGYVQAGPFTPECVLDHPEAVQELHREFADAGAEFLQALSFYASRDKLATTGHGGDARAINRMAVRLARSAAGADTLVAGNLSLTWVYDPKHATSPERVRKLFDEQLEAQMREGVDFVVAETFSWLGEALLATERIKKVGGVAMVTMSFDRRPLSYDGHTPTECARALHDAGADVIGVNCLRNPFHMLPIAEEMRHAVTGHVACQPTAYRTPADQPDFTATKEFPFETETLLLSRRDMAAYARQARDLGLNVIGSCCGSIPVHVREMARALDKRPADPAWRVDYGKPMSAYEYYGHGKDA